MLNKKETYNLKKIKDKEFILYHHLGLGDHIICAGLVNYLSKNYKTIHLPVKRRNLQNVNFLYENNPSVSTFIVDIEDDDILKYSKKVDLKILKIGFRKRGKPFNSGFYKQINLPYDISFNNFGYKRDIPKEINLYKHLSSEHNVNANYGLVHAESSLGDADLKIRNDIPVIYIKKETDIYNNIFLYMKLIEEAQEIHCIDSSFLHLVERSETKAKLFFHNIKNNKIKGANLELVKNWEIIDYL